MYIQTVRKDRKIFVFLLNEWSVKCAFKVEVLGGIEMIEYIKVRHEIWVIGWEKGDGKSTFFGEDSVFNRFIKTLEANKMAFNYF